MKARRLALLVAAAVCIAVVVAVWLDWRAVVLLAVRVAAPIGLGVAILLPVLLQVFLVRITVGVRMTFLRGTALIGLFALEALIAAVVGVAMLAGGSTQTAPP